MISVTIEIDQEGKSEVSVEGVSGGACHDVTRALEKALGTKTADRRTGEFWGRMKQTQAAPQEENQGF